jgi:hypothetical protein
MSTVRWKYSKESTMRVAVVNKILCVVTAMAVKYERMTVSLSACFLLCEAVKTLL